MNRPSLQRTLLTAIGGVAVAAVVLAGGLTLGLLRLTGERSTIAELRREAELAARLGLSAQLPRSRLGERLLPRRQAVRRVLGPEVRFVQPGGTSEFDGLPPEGKATVDGEAVLYASAQTARGSVYVYRPVSEVPGLPEGLAGRVLLAGLAALAVSAVVAFVLAQRIARPLERLASAARRYSHGETADLPSGSEPAEVAGLREAFVEMSGRLAAARETERSFLLSVSHELRTPLTAIRGYGEALSDGTATGAEKAGTVIVKESGRLERLVGDLIDLAKLRAGEFSVITEEVDLAQVARSVAAALAPKADDAGVTLEARADVPVHVTTDPDRVHQMLANLAENALRVTPSGGKVWIGVDRTGDGPAVTVGDTGPGMEPGDVAHAFERFYLWRRYRGERPVGTGLGLAIVDELSRALGVRVAVDSEPGRGTRFTLRFR